MNEGVTLRPPPVCTGRGRRLCTHGVGTAYTPCSPVCLHAPDMGASFMASCLSPTSKSRRHSQEDAFLRGSRSPLTHSLTHSLTHVKHGASQSTAQCARKHLHARAALAHTQEALAKKVGIVPSLRLCCPSVVTPPGRRWPLLLESLLRYPNQVFYTCRGGYSLDRKLGNATNVSSTNVRLCLPAHRMTT